MLLSFCGGNSESNQESSPLITTNEKPALENQENTDEDFNYDLLLTFSDCVNENGLEMQNKFLINLFAYQVIFCISKK